MRATVDTGGIVDEIQGGSSTEGLSAWRWLTCMAVPNSTAWTLIASRLSMVYRHVDTVNVCVIGPYNVLNHGITRFT